MILRPLIFSLGIFFTCLYSLSVQQGMFVGKTGHVHFLSDAPLELIKASSKELSGIIDPTNNGVAFSIRVVTFHGFNSAVQREHFMENYMEVSRYPVATFTGKIIEALDFQQDGVRNVRIKGLLNIHGVTVERIVPGTLIIKGNLINASASFTVPMKEHAITIPKLLSQKIAEGITVNIELTLQKVP
jgi:hypothetical protein